MRLRRLAAAPSSRVGLAVVAGLRHGELPTSMVYRRSLSTKVAPHCRSALQPQNGCVAVLQRRSTSSAAGTSTDKPVDTTIRSGVVSAWRPTLSIGTVTDTHGKQYTLVMADIKEFQGRPYDGQNIRGYTVTFRTRDRTAADSASIKDAVDVVIGDVLPPTTTSSWDESVGTGPVGTPGTGAGGEGRDGEPPQRRFGRLVIIQGVVTEWVPEEGTGLIRGADGRTYFTNIGYVKESRGVRPWPVGSLVKFKPGMKVDANGVPSAASVVLISAAPTRSTKSTEGGDGVSDDIAEAMNMSPEDEKSLMDRWEQEIEAEKRYFGKVSSWSFEFGHGTLRGDHDGQLYYVNLSGVHHTAGHTPLPLGAAVSFVVPPPMDEDLDALDAAAPTSTANAAPKVDEAEDKTETTNETTTTMTTDETTPAESPEVSATEATGTSSTESETSGKFQRTDDGAEAIVSAPVGEEPFLPIAFAVRVLDPATPERMAADRDASQAVIAGVRQGAELLSRRWGKLPKPEGLSKAESRPRIARAKGTVKEWKFERGWGIIEGDNGQEYFTCLDFIWNPGLHLPLPVGYKVSYVPREDLMRDYWRFPPCWFLRILAEEEQPDNAAEIARQAEEDSLKPVI